MEMTARTTEPDGKSSKPLLGRIALVTGGSRGLGAAIAKELADAGATTIVNYHRTADLATHVLEEIEAAGRKAFAEQCNVADYDEVERMFGRIKEERGRLDILVNNAAIVRDHSFTAWKSSPSLRRHTSSSRSGISSAFGVTTRGWV
jgi:3-oxoacyl-[acyl-carrier protein] reductase